MVSSAAASGARRARSHRRRVRLLGVHPDEDAPAPTRGARREQPRRGRLDAGVRLVADRLYRDWMIRNLDDSRQIARYEERGVAVVKGPGRLAGPGRVEADGRVLETERRDRRHPREGGEGRLPRRAARRLLGPRDRGRRPHRGAGARTGNRCRRRDRRPRAGDRSPLHVRGEPRGGRSGSLSIASVMCSSAPWRLPRSRPNGSTWPCSPSAPRSRSPSSRTRSRSSRPMPRAT